MEPLALLKMVEAGKTAAFATMIDLAQNAEDEGIRFEAAQLVLSVSTPNVPLPEPVPDEDGVELEDYADMPPEVRQEIADAMGTTPEEIDAKIAELFAKNLEADETGLEDREDATLVPAGAMVPATPENLEEVERKLAAAQAAQNNSSDEMPPGFRPGASGVGHARPSRKARRSKRGHGR